MRVEAIVLCPAQSHRREGLDLDRLVQRYAKASLAQVSHHAPFVAAAGFDTNAPDIGIPQDLRQPAPARQIIAHLPTLRAAMHGDVQHGLAGIDAGDIHAMLRHLHCPYLVMRT
jgi:hypothetical protein